jgi:hypothetical protein
VQDLIAGSYVCERAARGLACPSEGLNDLKHGRFSPKSILDIKDED